MTRREFCMAVYIQAISAGKESHEAFQEMVDAGINYDEFFGVDDE